MARISRMGSNALDIAVIPGDGIGKEVIPATLVVLERLERVIGGFSLDFKIFNECGAAYYAQSGRDCSEAAFAGARSADAILLGAIGLPHIRFPAGTEITPHLRMREEFGLYAGIRPVKAYPNTPRRLADPRAAEIDLVIVRESTEGLFFTQGRGEVIGDSEARETLRITRATTEKLCDAAFRLAERRKMRRGHAKVTCVDKANVFKAFAFFRKIFDERARAFPEIESGHNYVDAQALDLIRRPWDFDVMVTENMFGDILSDLAGGLVGGMGMAPCAELGDEHGLFQPAHGSAPDIAGQDKANPTATFLSAALMLDWLAQRTGNQKLSHAAETLESVVAAAFASNMLRPMEFGGDQGLKAATAAVLDVLDAKFGTATATD